MQKIIEIIGKTADGTTHALREIYPMADEEKGRLIHFLALDDALSRFLHNIETDYLYNSTITIRIKEKKDETN